VNLLASNCWINLIYIDDFIALEIKLENVLTTLKKGEIRDLTFLNKLGLMNFGTIVCHFGINHKHCVVIDVRHFIIN
jgi:hypothetical protein